ncbi:MAG: kelch motif-containing protein [Thermoplasmata archaeon]|nr:kelch motif-containing protein [Thermoplasmata archaeon]
MRNSLVHSSLAFGAVFLLLTTVPTFAAPSHPSAAANLPLSVTVLPPVDAASMAYDARDGYLVLFGGANVGTGNGSFYSNETWIRQAGHWIQLHPVTSPPARGYGAMAYDDRDGYVLLFGGRGNSPSVNGGLNDSWSFVAGNWTRLITPIAPERQIGPAMAFDSGSGKVIFFGGETRAGWLRNDTWQFSGGNWSRIAIGNLTHSPTARKYAAMTYDAKDGYVVLFGGHGRATLPLNDTWAFSHGTWRNITNAHSPPAGIPGALVFDFKAGYVVLFGGLHGGSWRNDTWEFSGGNWTRVFPPSAPPPTGPVAESYNPVASAVVIVELNSGSRVTHDQSWSFSSGVWTRV